MKLICERSALSKALGHVASRARNKLKIPILEHVLIDATDNNKLSLAATDLDTRCTARCPAEVSKAGRTTVSADRLARLVDGLAQGSQVLLDLRGNDLHVESGKSRYKLPTMPATDFPDISEITPSAVITLKPGEAKRLFGETSPGLPATDARMYLFGGFLHQRSKGQIAVTATDGLRLVRTSVDNDARLDRGWIIPKPTMPELVKLDAGDELTLRLSDNAIEVRTGNVTFTSKLIDATYPDMGAIIPRPANLFILADRGDFVGAFKRLAGLAAENSTLNFRWKEGETSIEMWLAGNGSGVETVGCECGLPDGEIAFQPNILGGMLDVIEGDVIQLHLTDPNRPMLIVDPNDSGLTVIAMPCKGRG